MTAKEKAKELVDNFKPIASAYAVTEDGNGQRFAQVQYNNAKQCALICVDEILKTDPQKVEYIDDRVDPLLYEKKCKGNTKYWQEVKKEIEKL